MTKLSAILASTHLSVNRVIILKALDGSTVGFSTSHTTFQTVHTIKSVPILKLQEVLLVSTDLHLLAIEIFYVMKLQTVDWFQQ
jgi:hypothetical protein